MKTDKLKGPLRALHLFLQERMSGRYILGTGSFNPRVPVRIDIDTFNMLMDLLREALDTADWETADRIAVLFENYDRFLTNPRYDGHALHLANMRTAIAKRSRVKAEVHRIRLGKVVHKVAADRIFEDGERVAINRSENGWHGGRLCGRVKAGSGGHVVEGDDGFDYQIRHLRDIR